MLYIYIFCIVHLKLFKIDVKKWLVGLLGEMGDFLFFKQFS